MANQKGLPSGHIVKLAAMVRQGRAWKSPRGGMYESILLRPEVEMRELPTLALVVALAVRRALASLVADDQARRICIKWPNDVVLVGGTFPQTNAPSIKNLYSKLAGISSEVHAGGICVGIGVNVEPPEDAMEVGGKERAGLPGRPWLRVHLRARSCDQRRGRCGSP